MSNDEMIVIKGTQHGNAATVLLRGANDFLLDEMDRSLHDSFCIVKRVLESGNVVPGEQSLHTLSLQGCSPCTLGGEEVAAKASQDEQSLTRIGVSAN